MLASKVSSRSETQMWNGSVSYKVFCGGGGEGVQHAGA